jgi:hypothetical protein
MANGPALACGPLAQRYSARLRYAGQGSLARGLAHSHLGPASKAAHARLTRAGQRWRCALPVRWWTQRGSGRRGARRVEVGGIRWRHNDGGADE